LDPSQHPQLDLRDLVEERYPGHFRRAGAWLTGRSPYRDDHKPSYAVKADRWIDFGTGEGGNILSWVQREYGYTRSEALAWLNEKTGSAAQLPRRTRCPESHTSEPPPSDWQQEASSAIRQCEAYLWSGAPDARRALNYLRRNRGLSDQTIRAFHLGYNPNWRKLDWRNPETDQRVRLAPGITIPWRADDALWGVRVRCRVGALAATLNIAPDRGREGEELPKYLGLAGGKSSGALFNGDALKPGEEVLIVEGEFDAMLAQQEIGVIVVTLGSASSGLSRRWRDRLKVSRRIYSTMDNDDAGQQATAKLRASLGETLTCVNVSAGKDITEYVIDHDGDLRAWWDDAMHRRHFTNGVPDSWRSTLLRHTPEAALLFELLNAAIEAGEIDPDRITRPALKAASLSMGWGLTANTIDRGFETLAKVFLSIFPTDQPTPDSVGNFEKKGRRAEVHQLLDRAAQRRNLLELAIPAIIQRRYPVQARPERPPVAAPISVRALVEGLEIDPGEATSLAKALDQVSKPIYVQQVKERRKAARGVRRDYQQLDERLRDLTSAPLPEGWPIGSLREYRTAVLRAWKLHYPEADWLSGNSKTARALGLSVRSMDTYLERAGIEVEGDRREERPLASPHNVERQAVAIGYELQGRPLGFRIVAPDGQPRPPEPYCREGAQRAADLVAAGAQVYVVCQVANKHTALEAALPPLSARQPPVRKPVSETSEVPRRPALPPRRRVSGYRPEWVRGQILLRYTTLGWTRASGYFNPRTGEVVPSDAETYQLLRLLIDGDGSEPLFGAAAGRGAVVRRL
jgi:hypothetical protein